MPTRIAELQLGPRIALVLCVGALAASALAAEPSPAASEAETAPQQATTPRRRVAVLDLSTPSNLSGIAYKLTHDTRQLAAQDPAVELVPQSEVEKALGGDGLKALQACGVRADCLLAHSARVPAERLIVGTLDRDPKNYRVALAHLDLQRRSVLASVQRTVLIASRRLNADFAAALPALLRGEAEANGKIFIETNTPDVLVSVNGVVFGSTPLTVEALPGKHLIKLTKRSFMPVERYVTVEAGKTVTMTERLLLKP